MNSLNDEAIVTAERQGALPREGGLPSSVSAIRVAFVAPSLRYVGGQSVQADLLIKNWRNDPDIAPTFVPVDPRFPLGFAGLSSCRACERCCESRYIVGNCGEA